MLLTMDRSEEYKKTCPYDGKAFIANHLSQIYCSEACKRHMFRKKLQDKRKSNNKEINLFKKNNTLIKNFSSRGITKVTKSELINSGFDQSYYLKKFMHNKTWLVLLEDFYLEAISDNEYLIHKY